MNQSDKLYLDTIYLLGIQTTRTNWLRKLFGDRVPRDLNDEELKQLRSAIKKEAKAQARAAVRS